MGNGTCDVVRAIAGCQLTAGVGWVYVHRDDCVRSETVNVGSVASNVRSKVVNAGEVLSMGNNTIGGGFLTDAK